MSSPSSTDEAKMELPVPRQWLEGILNQKAGATAKLLHTECRMINKGKGFLSVITQAKLTWSVDAKGTKLPASVVMKQPSPSQVNAVDIDDMFADALDENLLRELHNKECDAYAMLRAFEDKPPIPVAECYYAEKRDDDHAGMIIMEDFCDIARSLHFNDDLDLGQIFTLVECIAKLQSYGFRHPSCQDKYDLEPLSTNLYVVLMMKATKSAKFIREKYPGELKYTDEQIQSFLSKALDNIERFKELDTNYFTPVVCSGDLQVNNLLWRLNDDGHPTGDLAAIVDFQFFSLNNCLNDLMWDLVVAVDPETRRRNADSLLSHYQDIVSSNTDGRSSITMNELKRIYKHGLLQFGLSALVWVEIISGMPADHQMREGRDKEALGRAIAAIEDALET